MQWNPGRGGTAFGFASTYIVLHDTRGYSPEFLCIVRRILSPGIRRKTSRFLFVLTRLNSCTYPLYYDAS